MRKTIRSTLRRLHPQPVLTAHLQTVRTARHHRRRRQARSTTSRLPLGTIPSRVVIYHITLPLHGISMMHHLLRIRPGLIFHFTLWPRSFRQQLAFTSFDQQSGFRAWFWHYCSVLSCTNYTRRSSVDFSVQVLKIEGSLKLGGRGQKTKTKKERRVIASTMWYKTNWHVL